MSMVTPTIMDMIIIMPNMSMITSTRNWNYWTSANIRTRTNGHTPLKSKARFADRAVTNGQIILFGLSGGLLPCPAAFSILLLCLQLKEFTVGFALVLCFSIGLAITLVTVGATAAWSIQHASRRMKGFPTGPGALPYLSSTVLTLLGVYLIFAGRQEPCSIIDPLACFRIFL